MKRFLVLYGCTLFLSACASDPSIGSKIWHEGRIGEIEAAYAEGEVSTEDYLSLKNETDATRVEYQKVMTERLRHRPSFHYYPYHSVYHSTHPHLHH